MIAGLAPERRSLRLWAEMPASLRQPRPSAWADLNMGGQELGCFLEGPCFDDLGDLLLVDIPFGRILRVDGAGSWSVVAEYDGWPNGMKWTPQGLLVADHKLGLVRVDAATGNRTQLFAGWGDQPLLGLNDLAVAADGVLHVTDQGQSGLHAPNGRVLRIAPDGAAETLLDNCPSPNGLVMDGRRNWLYVAMTRGNCVWRVPLVEGRPTKVGVAIQLSGGIGPDGLALDPTGCLLVVHAPLGVWQFDSQNLPRRFFAAPEGAYVTNLALREEGGRSLAFVTDSMNGRILVADLGEDP